ncbi:NlpC/P60 family peptidoglycan-binding protein RipD [Mycobacterium neumannii]|uniref:NlpC/P60 family peptidoglycan-binding protein RipD n=1 Tax=Mycobacterium neumannii TaxID=2048551 RepID=UPI000B93B2A6|nr:NlpC/P60 family peptidoglycan-binding protein RipD [Mycobacterium neumannii]VEG41419.1 cell wall-associated hydrolase, invasion-associated protein [Mycolicibacterium flavescens]
MRRIYALVIGVALLVAIPGVAVAAPSSRSAANQQAVDLVIARGLAQRGVPFSYGGGDANGPTKGSGTPENVAGLDREGHIVGLDPALSTVGFDASGLMVYSFAGIGVKLPRSSGAQYNVGQKVLPSEALPGDLIFYGPNGDQSVALFLGNGQMLETADTGVTVSPVRTSNMAPYLVRIIK